ncbi:MAG TPA: sulfotransferase [Steroidobacteraceae bacterium]
MAERARNLLQRGVAAAEQGRVAAGLTLIDESIALDPRDPEAHAQRARWLSRLYRTDEALAATQQALALSPDRALTCDTLGVVLSRAGRHERAVECFDRATRLDPGNAVYHFNRAASLKFLGRFDESAAAYEACLARDPHFWRAHSALATTRRQTPQCNHVARLEQLLGTPDLDPDAEWHLRHALARELEDLGRDAESFAHLQAGNARKHASVGYDPDRDRQLFGAVARLFARELPAPDSDLKPDTPIFVVGLPRTGTTLVERVLSSHSQVASAGESQMFGILLKRATRTRSTQVLDLATLEASTRIDWAALGRDYLAAVRPPGGRPRFVDKMPLNFFYLGHIARAWPNARMVVLRRHPLDTGLSLFRQLFAANVAYYDYARDLRAIGRYYAGFDALMRHWRSVLPGRIHELHYEALVHDQAGETRRLLEHCGLPWEEQCLAFERNPEAVATASAVQVRQPLYAASVGRWRRFATQLQPLIEELERAGVVVPD